METAIQVSPTSEGVRYLEPKSEYNQPKEQNTVQTTIPENPDMIREFFSGLANTLVDASKLRAEVDALKVALSDVRKSLADVSTDRNHAWAEVDRLRAEGEAAARKAQEEQSWRDHEIASLRERLNNSERTITTLREEVTQIAQARNDANQTRDDAELRAMELEDANKKQDQDIQLYKENALNHEWMVTEIRNLLSLSSWQISDRRKPKPVQEQPKLSPVQSGGSW